MYTRGSNACGPCAEYRALLRMRRASREWYDDPRFLAFSRLLLKVRACAVGCGVQCPKWHAPHCQCELVERHRHMSAVHVPQALKRPRQTFLCPSAAQIPEHTWGVDTKFHPGDYDRWSNAGGVTGHSMAAGVGSAVVRQAHAMCYRSLGRTCRHTLLLGALPQLP